MTTAACGPEEEAPSSLLRYVALGDSYSSGEGVTPFERFAPTPQPEECHQSRHAYSRQVAESELGVELVGFLACSGAKTANITTTPQYAGKSQNAYLATLGEVDLVTVTIGGNDIGFAPFVEACLLGTDSECGTAYHVSLELIASTLPSLLSSTYSAIRDTVGPDARIIVLGYPQIVPDDPDDCKLLGVFDFPVLTAGRTTWAHEVTARLNETIKSAVAQAGPNIVFLNATASGSPFQGHNLCTSDPYVNGVVLFDPSSSFHPTKEGHQAYAQMVIDHLRGGDADETAAPDDPGPAVTAVAFLTSSEFGVVKGDQVVTVTAEFWGVGDGWNPPDSFHFTDDGQFAFAVDGRRILAIEVSTLQAREIDCGYCGTALPIGDSEVAFLEGLTGTEPVMVVDLARSDPPRSAKPGDRASRTMEAVCGGDICRPHPTPAPDTAYGGGRVAYLRWTEFGPRPVVMVNPATGASMDVGVPSGGCSDIVWDLWWGPDGYLHATGNPCDDQTHDVWRLDGDYDWTVVDSIPGDTFIRVLPGGDRVISRADGVCSIAVGADQLYQTTCDGWLDIRVPPVPLR